MPKHPYLADNLPYEVPEQLLDFKVFVHLAWEAMGLPEPTRMQLDMANFLQDGDILKKLVQAHRGAAKSWLTDAYCTWRLYLNPFLSIVMISASGDFSTENSRQVKRLIELLDFLEPLRGNVDGQSSRADKWDTRLMHINSKEPNFKALGVDGMLTGNRGDLLIWDDVETSVNCLTQLRRDQLKEKFDEGKYLFKGGVPQETIILGTPHHADSLYNGMGRKGYHCRVWPAQYGWDASRYEGEISPMLVQDREVNPDLSIGGVFGFGQPTHPDLFPESDLRQRAEEGETAGKGKWAAQMMLDNRESNADKHPLKLSDLVVMDCHPEKAPEEVLWGTSFPNGASSKLADMQCYGLPGDAYYGPRQSAETLLDYTRKIMIIDPSGKGKDETAYCIMAELNGYFYCLKLGGFKGGYDEETVIKPLAKLAQQYGCHEATYEANWGDSMFGHIAMNIFRKHAPSVSFVLDGMKVPNTQKEVRIIDTLEPVLNFHKLVMDRQVIEDDALLLSSGDYPQSTAPGYMWQYQLSRLTDERGCLGHDDRIDALHLAVAHLQSMLLVDAEAVIAERQEEEDQAEDRFIDAMIRQGKGHSSRDIVVDDDYNQPMWGESVGGSLFEY